MRIVSLLTVAGLFCSSAAAAAEPKIQRDVAYAEPKVERQSLDVYAPPEGQDHPIVVWIHGGGWRQGDKRLVQQKPQAFVEQGCVFVSINYRFVPQVTVKEMTGDVAKAIRWVHDHAGEFGSKKDAIFVMGHSAGAHLAALVCTDDSYLKAEGLSLSILKGCVPVDTAAYDVAKRFGDSGPLKSKAGEAVFGKDAAGHRDLSPVTHVKNGKSIPPFLILHVADRADSKAQSELFAKTLEAAGIAAALVPAAGKTHGTINSELGVAGDKPTEALFEFVKRQAAGEPLKLRLRSQKETAPKSGQFETVVREQTWQAPETAIVVCDMWDAHTCPNAAQRVAEMAPRMNEVLKAARSRGVLIIHCPSDTMKFYADHPGRKLAQQAPKVETARPLERWCYLDKDREPPLPIDDSDGGCDCERTWKKGDPYPWTRQIATLEIMDGDAITDSAEAYYLMRQRGIKNLIVMGVHTNMCVLGRPFSIRQMVYQGMNVALMRDLTDTMYNPAMAPFVSHFEGTDLVVGHIERYWCPTLISGDLLDGKAFRFPGDTRAEP
jgi:acetyl esterase/lipase/nicotinamidase-related amidase